MSNDFDSQNANDSEESRLRLQDLLFENADLFARLKETLALATELRAENAKLKDKVDRQLSLDSGSLQKAVIPSELYNILDRESEGGSIRGTGERPSEALSRKDISQASAELSFRPTRKEQGQPSVRGSYTKIHLDRGKSLSSNTNIVPEELRKKTVPRHLELMQVFSVLVQTTGVQKSNFDSFFSSAPNQELLENFQLEVRQKDAEILELREQLEAVTARLTLLDYNSARTDLDIILQLTEKNSEIERLRQELFALRQDLEKQKQGLFVSFHAEAEVEESREEESASENYASQVSDVNQSADFMNQQVMPGELSGHLEISQKGTVDFSKKFASVALSEEAPAEEDHSELIQGSQRLEELRLEVEELNEKLRASENSLRTLKAENEDLKDRQRNFEELEEDFANIKKLLEEATVSRDLAVRELGAIKLERNYIYAQFQSSQESTEAIRAEKIKLQTALIAAREEARQLIASQRSLATQQAGLTDKWRPSENDSEAHAESSDFLNSCMSKETSPIRRAEGLGLDLNSSLPLEAIQEPEIEPDGESQTDLDNQVPRPESKWSRRTHSPPPKVELSSLKLTIEKHNSIPFAQLLNAQTEKKASEFFAKELENARRVWLWRQPGLQAKSTLLFSSISRLLFSGDEFVALVASLMGEKEGVSSLEVAGQLYLAFRKKLALVSLMVTKQAERKTKSRFPLQKMFLTNEFLRSQDSRWLREAIIQYIKWSRAARVIQKAYRAILAQRNAMKREPMDENGISQFFVMSGKSELNQLFDKTENLMGLLRKVISRR